MSIASREGRESGIQKDILVALQSTFTILPHLTKVRDFLPAAGESASVARSKSSVGSAVRLADDHAGVGSPGKASAALEHSARPTLLQ
jgi:hypothetical protein